MFFINASFFRNGHALTHGRDNVMCRRIHGVIVSATSSLFFLAIVLALLALHQPLLFSAEGKLSGNLNSSVLAFCIHISRKTRRKYAII